MTRGNPKAADRASGLGSGMELRVHPAMADIGLEAWDGLAGSDLPPFVHFEWLDALERFGCVGGDSGWAPAHLGLWQGERLLAFCPTYIKSNSEGEFVFDHAWADFARRAGVRYYPKIVVAIPFTPATGPRVLVRKEVDRGAAIALFADALRTIADERSLSSAHVLFPEPTEAALWGQAGLAVRHGVQFHWTNRGYATFDDFLATFNAKRRHQVRRERREVEAQGIVIETLKNEALTPEVIDTMFEFYLSTLGKFGPWGRQYLTRAFFHNIAKLMPEAIEIVMARDRDGRPVGGAWNLAGGGALFGRYWGAREERPFLHFAVCYYHGVAEAIARGLSRFEPGAGGEHKRVRGFDPVVTYSAHHLRDPRMDEVIRDYLARERTAVTDFVQRESE